MNMADDLTGDAAKGERSRGVGLRDYDGNAAVSTGADITIEGDLPQEIAIELHGGMGPAALPEDVLLFGGVRVFQVAHVFGDSEEGHI